MGAAPPKPCFEGIGGADAGDAMPGSESTTISAGDGT